MSPKAWRYGRRNDAILAAVVYAACALGLFLYVSGSTGVERPSPGGGMLGLLFFILPAILALALALSAARAFADYRAKRSGAGTRLRTLGLFILIALLAALPPWVFMGDLARRAYEAPTTVTVRQGLDAGFESLLAHYEEQERVIAIIAARDVPARISAQGMDASAALADIAVREPSLAALEYFGPLGSVSYAGPPELRSQGNTPSERAGLLPRLPIGGTSYARYFAPEVAKTRDGRSVSVTVSLRVDQLVERAAERVSAARKVLAEAAPGAERPVRSIALFGAAMAVSLMGLAAVFSFLASDALVAPLAALENAIRNIDTGQARAPFLAKREDDASRLIEALNSSLARIERHRGDQLRSERLVAWRDMARLLAHELRNPLTPIRLSAERVLRRWREDPSAIDAIVEKAMLAIIQESAHMEGLLAEFREFARLPEPHKDWLELRELVEGSVNLYSASWPGMSIDLSAVPPGLFLRADRGHMKQLLGNLLSNAAEAMDGKGHIWIRAELVKTQDSRYCRLHVLDDGPGIPEDIGERIFTPYFSTKQGGTGLGLAVVEHIVSAHGGSIRQESPPGRGATFIIDIPADDTPRA